MATSDRIPTPIEWSNWQYGDWGSYGPELTGQHWHGINCQVYEDGSVGPRPGWKLLTTLTGQDAVIPQSLIWRRQDTNKYLHVEGSVGSTHTIKVVPITIANAGASPNAGTIGTITNPLSSDDSPGYKVDPTYWSSGVTNPTNPWFHNVSLGEGAVVTSNGIVYETVESSGTYSPGTRVDVAPNKNPVIAEPYGVRMFYTGVKAEATSYWYSEPNDFDELYRDPLDLDTINTADTSLSNSPFSAITMLKEMGEGLLIGTLDGKLFTLRGATPRAGVFRLLQTVGAPYLPTGYVLVADNVFFVPIDGRGVTIANVDSVDAQSFNHLRFLEHNAISGSGKLLKRGGIVGRAIGNRYNQYVSFLCKKDTDVALTGNTSPFTTLEFNNGVWHPSEVIFAEAVDYCSIPGGKIARAIKTNSGTKIFTREETNNSPVPGSWSANLRDEETFLSNTGISEDDATSSILILPEFKLHGAAEIQMESLVIELDYWKDSTEYSPELFSHIRMLTPTDKANLPDSQPLEDLFNYGWGENLLRSPWTGRDDRPPWLTRKKRTTETTFVLPDGENQRWYVLIPGLTNINAGNGFQLAIKFRDISVRRIVPTVNVQQWLQFIADQKALGAAPTWGG